MKSKDGFFTFDGKEVQICCTHLYFEILSGRITQCKNCPFCGKPLRIKEIKEAEGDDQ